MRFINKIFDKLGFIVIRKTEHEKLVIVVGEEQKVCEQKMIKYLKKAVDREIYDMYMKGLYEPDMVTNLKKKI